MNRTKKCKYVVLNMMCHTLLTLYINAHCTFKIKNTLLCYFVEEKETKGERNQGSKKICQPTRIQMVKHMLMYEL